MRILDADALLKMINSKKGMIGCTGLRNYINFMAKDDKEIVRRKKGEWLYDEEREATGIYAICSCCDEKVYQCGEWLFCPRCGADMRKEENAND